VHWPSRCPSGPLRPRKNPPVLQAVKVKVVPTSKVVGSNAVGSKMVVNKVAVLAAMVSIVRFHPS